MKHLGLFEGIGGFSLAARWMGWETVAWCEWNERCQKLLKQHFPSAQGHGDIKETDFKQYANRIDILTGGFPCQPYSTAGKRLGKEDDRHLWPEMLRAIREVRPRWIVGENVSGILNWNEGMVLDEIKTDLETEGYEVFPPLHIGAVSVNAPHRRMRVWIIAYASGFRCDRYVSKGEGIQWSKQTRRKIRSSDYENRPSANTNALGLEGIKEETKRQFAAYGDSWDQFPTQSPICGGDDGIPDRVDRIKGLGNAIVPQVALQIYKAIEQYEILTHK